MLLFASENCPMVPEEPCLRLSGRCGTNQETSLYMVAVERGCESVQADSSCKCYPHYLQSVTHYLKEHAVVWALPASKPAETPREMGVLF